MKFKLVIICLLLALAGTAQQNVFKLSAQKQILTVHLNQDNTNKLLTIDTKGRIANVQRLTIRGQAPEQDAGWVRVFHIATTEKSEALVTIQPDSATGSFYVGLRDLATRLKPGKYQIYTIALPKDATKAAELKPGRVLVATLEVV